MPLQRYRLYVDEVGSDDFGNLHHPAHRYFGLTGVAFAAPSINALHDELEALKGRHFEIDPDDGPLVLHRSDLVKGRGRFQAMQDPVKLAAFGEDWIGMLERFDFTVFTILVDKYKMANLESSHPRSPYHYAMERLTERFVHFLARRDGQGDIMPEMRKGRKDEALQAAFEQVWRRGTEALHHDIVSTRLPAVTLKFRSKADNVAGLQVADSVAHPSAKVIRRAGDPSIELSGFERRFSNLLLTARYDRSPVDPNRIWGFGVEEIP